MAVKNAEPTPAVKAHSGGIKRVNVGELQGASYNPQSRVKPKSSRMRQLMKSIEEEGLIYPVAISEEGIVIDGHRRLAACKMLGWDEVPCLVLKNKNRSKLYAEINATPEMMSGHQVLTVYLHEPEAVSPRTRALIARHEERYGKAALKRVAKAGMSFYIMSTADRISSYCEDDSTEFRKKALNWVVNNRNNRLVKNYMTMKQPAAPLWQMVAHNKPLTLAFA